MKQAFIVLSHQGLTMVGAIAEHLKRRGLVACVLSSSSARGLTPDWLHQVERFHFIKALSLTERDAYRFIESISEEFQIVGCISVWDGYRELMACVNQSIGACDVQPEIIHRLRDKLAFRNALHCLGLSEKQAHALDAASFETLSDPSSLFIKPRTGLASFGAFRADKVSSYHELEEIWGLTATDLAHDGIFDQDPAFIVEEFICGKEFSFEVSVSQKRVTVHAVHEKVDITPMHRTVLENACLCPPVSLGIESLAAGIELVERSLLALGVDEGVYHVEARYDPREDWEIIEANPRIGGAYIVDSTRLHCGIDLIGYWIELISGQCRPVDSIERRKTFFRVFFGEPGRVISRLSRAETGYPVVIDKLFVKEGECLPRADREIFIGQALWDITRLATSEIANFVDSTKSHFSVEYGV